MIREPVYILTLRALPSDVPPEIRLRQLLKIALRRFGMKCIDHREAGKEAAEPMTAKANH
jgi:hypothetical protein